MCPPSYAAAWFPVHQPVWIGRISTLPPSCQRHGVSRDTGGSGSRQEPGQGEGHHAADPVYLLNAKAHTQAPKPLSHSGSLERNLCSPDSGKTCFSTRVCFIEPEANSPPISTQKPLRVPGGFAVSLCVGAGECESGHSGLQSKLSLHRPGAAESESAGDFSAHRPRGERSPGDRAAGRAAGVRLVTGLCWLESPGHL